MTRIIATCNHKGGVGKTTIAVNLAACLPGKTLLVDLDAQRSASLHLCSRQDIERATFTAYELLAGGGGTVPPTEAKGIHLIPGHYRLSVADVVLQKATPDHLARNLHYPEFDYIVLDCPPSLGTVTAQALYAADGVLVPTTPDYLSIQGLADFLEAVKVVQKVRKGKPKLLGIVINKMDLRVGLSNRVFGVLAGKFGDKFLEDYPIPHRVKYAEAAAHRRPITSEPDAGDAREAFKRLALEVSRRLQTRKAT